jgi:ribosomal protein S6--L-glutamate ligase
MQIAVLANSDSWYFRDLSRAAGSDFALTCLPFEQLHAEVYQAAKPRILAGDQPLAAFDAVLVRTMSPGTLEQVVFRMDLLQCHAAAGGVVLNPPRAVEAAVDKYLTTAKLVAAGLPSPKTIVCQTAEDALAAFANLGNDVVIKPLFGSEGRGITRVTDEALALRAFKMLEQLGAIIYLQEFIAHPGYDCRLFILGEACYAMKRSNPLDWRTNVSRGAVAEKIIATPEMISLARQAADAVGAKIAGVDLLPAGDGSYYVLEVNAVPGWKALAHVLQVDIAREVLQYTRQQVLRARGANA